jgi:hypothetical protein
MRVVLSLPLTSWHPISRSREDAGLLSIRPTSMKFAVQEGRNCASLFKLGILVEDEAIARWIGISVYRGLPTRWWQP